MKKFFLKINKYIAQRLRDIKCVIFLIVTGALLLFLCLPQFTIDNLKITSSSLFSGLLALNGFVFAARTFIVFKIYDTVYSDENYQKKN